MIIQNREEKIQGLGSFQTCENLNLWPSTETCKAPANHYNTSNTIPNFRTS